MDVSTSIALESLIGVVLVANDMTCETGGMSGAVATGLVTLLTHFDESLDLPLGS